MHALIKMIVLDTCFLVLLYLWFFYSLNWCCSSHSTSDARNSEELISVDKKSSVDGWHVVQFSGGKNAPTLFDLTLYWRSGSTHNSDSPLLKLRTDVNRLTPITERVLEKLPRWCSLFGKSTSPYTLAFLTNLPVKF